MAKHAEECRQLTHSFTSESQGRQNHWHDKNQTPHVFSPGLVLLWVPSTTTALPSKFRTEYHGPYSISEKISPVNNIVEPITPSSDLHHRSCEIVHSAVWRLTTHSSCPHLRSSGWLLFVPEAIVANFAGRAWCCLGRLRCERRSTVVVLEISAMVRLAVFCATHRSALRDIHPVLLVYKTPFHNIIADRQL